MLLVDGLGSGFFECIVDLFSIISNFSGFCICTDDMIQFDTF